MTKQTVAGVYTLAQYQERAIATAEPRAFHLEYLVPGIVGEVGELFGQQAKAYWHEKPAEDLTWELINEFGDIAWMTALLLHTRGVSVLQPVYPALGADRWGKRDPRMKLLSASNNIMYQWVLEKEGISDSDHWMDEAAERLWRTLLEVCVPLVGVEFQHVLQANLNKLADRAARGVLRGSGDHR